VGVIFLVEPLLINSFARKKAEENFRFRTFIKNNIAEEELDKRFLILHHELFHDYDCSRCNNCCIAFSAPVSDSEIRAIATFLQLSYRDIISGFLVKVEDGYETTAPCSFLGKGGGCVIESCKPSSCREFPFTNKPERLSSLLGILAIAEQCPVVFEMLERLKKHYRFS
jgi:Fe-S-cluster containining protein